MRRLIAGLALSIGLASCSTPYSPPYIEPGSAPFLGISQVLSASPSREVDVVLVHGMCTHGETWATERIAQIANELSGIEGQSQSGSFITTATPEGLLTVNRQYTLARGKVNFTAIVWSPLTSSLKSKLAYDLTKGGPKRASLNGKLKDGLLNDCLADALIYQGASRLPIQRAMSNTLEKILASNSASAITPLILISDSLGSKITFDAVASLLNSAEKQSAIQPAVGRMAILFMFANQIPILRLAEQDISRTEDFRGGGVASEVDGLREIIRIRENSFRGAGVSKLSLVAFTDPNDLLSYRLQASEYTGTDVVVTNILVSNEMTIGGWLERPDLAHTGYRENLEVTKLLACGSVLSGRLAKSNSC